VKQELDGEFPNADYAQLGSGPRIHVGLVEVDWITITWDPLVLRDGSRLEST
jgi:hypothetical protein